MRPFVSAASGIPASTLPGRASRSARDGCEAIDVLARTASCVLGSIRTCARYCCSFPPVGDYVGHEGWGEDERTSLAVRDTVAVSDTDIAEKAIARN